ncbi:DUF1553 domain-containing protein [Limnoglobus roseus]|uniref:F5/8 type C domain-containing protein n=1 Tax=Limnoglobus roseus TaxID=2598579 RepID=A0A5C1AJ83_9BACT|nr:DUF1553 domain-containing protein [Limnoglobus roseus]QEL19519.1 hypothetical protein PX52LOC_06594 [Limnoglobus roseus]
MTPLFLAILFAPVPGSAVGAVDFDAQIAPLFARHCSACHGATKQKGGLRLDRKADAIRGGDSGPAITPHKPAESLLLKKARNGDPAERMPPTGPALTDEQIQLLTRWIEAGAPWPDAKEAAAGSDHWSFQPLNRPPVPLPKRPNPVDHFLESRLQTLGLTFNPPADRRTLIRRLKFDLLGLPPTPTEVDAFRNDPTADAYEKLVDRYLASPQYGERWARHWLDVVRFAESHGFEMNQPRPNAWPYRDWVIKSLNDDKPYDRFAFEQLAGDTVGADAATGFLVAGASDQVTSPDPVLTAQQRADELHDMVATTGSAFLGLTVGCARCHAHKFDPISQVDYYRVKAVFAGVRHGDREVKSPERAGRAKQVAQIRAEIADTTRRLEDLEPLADPAATDARRSPVNARVNVERFQPIRAKFVRFVVFATNSAEPCLDELEIFSTGPDVKNVALASFGATLRSAGNYPASDRHRLEHLNDGKYGNGRSWISGQPGRGRVTVELAEPTEIDRVVWGRDREEQFSDRLATRYRIDTSTDGERWTVVASSDDREPMGSGSPAPPGLNDRDRKEWTALSRQLRDLRAGLADLLRAERVYAGRLTTPEPTYRLHRGDATAKRELVSPAALAEIGSPLTMPATAPDADRRATFARWVIDPANPLTPRVIVNRLWQHHFGTGLVDTPSDFGRNGAKPTHPELLDWLAAELIERKWSLKQLHRLMVTSTAYRQSSAASSDGLAKDAQARFLWRYPPQRLEAEAIRDSILAVSGKLDLTMGGPGFDLFEPNSNYVRVFTPKKTFGPAEFRRMIYQMKPRMQLDDTFGVFDCPDGGQIAPKRNRSTTPLQSLNLLNSTFLLQQAGFLAERVEKDAGAEPNARVKRVFTLAFQRPPSDREFSAAVALVKDHGLPALCRAVLNANEFLYLD